MPKTWESTQEVVGKIRSALEKLAPPVPSDEFEAIRGDTLRRFEPLENYINGQITGEGGMSVPAAEPE